jgi:hypothetical protein
MLLMPVSFLFAISLCSSFFFFGRKREGIASTGCSFTYQLEYWWVTYHFKNTYSPITYHFKNTYSPIEDVLCDPKVEAIGKDTDEGHNCLI